MGGEDSLTRYQNIDNATKVGTWINRYTNIETNENPKIHQAESKSFRVL